MRHCVQKFVVTTGTSCATCTDEPMQLQLTAAILGGVTQVNVVMHWHCDLSWHMIKALAESETNQGSVDCMSNE